MASLELSTTGTLSTVVIDDLGEKTWTHPTTDYELIQTGEFTYQEIIESTDLWAAVTAGYIIIKNENGDSITEPDQIEGLQVKATPVNDNAIATFDGTSGDVLQDSGAFVEPAPSGGSGVDVVEYATPPVDPPTGFVWVEYIDANSRKLCYFDGNDVFSVELEKDTDDN